MAKIINLFVCLFIYLGPVTISATGSYLILIKQIDYLISALLASLEETNAVSFISTPNKIS